MQKVLNKWQAAEISNKLVDDLARANVGMRGVSKSYVQMNMIFEAYNNAYLTAYRYIHPRVVHLADHAKKARVRKKNQNRIRRMK